MSTQLRPLLDDAIRDGAAITAARSHIATLIIQSQRGTVEAPEPGWHRLGRRVKGIGRAALRPLRRRLRHARDRRAL